jgi:hypothetical protein
VIETLKLSRCGSSRKGVEKVSSMNNGGSQKVGPDHGHDGRMAAQVRVFDEADIYGGGNPAGLGVIKAADWSRALCTLRATRSVCRKKCSSINEIYKPELRVPAVRRLLTRWSQ